MVRIIVGLPNTQINNRNRYIEAAGLSTDTKPTDSIITGSLFFEVDTGKIYAFDEVSAEWTEIGG